MKCYTLLGLIALLSSQVVSAHYIFNTLIAGTINSTTAVRQPVDEYPLKNVTSTNITCNADPHPATATVNIAAGDRIGFKVLNNTIFHQGPAAIYLGTPPSGMKASAWDGSGANWFKIAEWGIIGGGEFGFTDYNATELYSTLPKNTPSGEYLVRIEQIGLHLIDNPEWYVSCAQINVTGGGSGKPSKVSIPGYVMPTNPEVTLNIYDPVPTSYTVPGPAVWNGN